MSLRTKAPILILAGIACTSTSALAGAAIGRYTVSGLNPLYTDSYRPMARYRAEASADAYWEALGQPDARVPG